MGGGKEQLTSRSWENEEMKGGIPWSRESKDIGEAEGALSEKRSREKAVSKALENIGENNEKARG